MSDHLIQIPLDLPNVEVQEISNTKDGHWLIRVESTLNHTTCKKCGHQIDEFHGFDAPICLRHLPLFEVPVYIELRPKRYRCRVCDNHPTTTQKLTWYNQRSPNTKAYERWLLKLLVNSTLSDVARKLAIHETVVTGTLERWVETNVNWSEYSELRVLGIDEIALKRGHRDYVVLVTTMTAQGIQILGVLGDRKKETVSHFLTSIPIHLKTTVEWVCSDMYEGFTNAVREQLPQSKVVIDRFHVAKLYRECADKVRKQELKRLKTDLSHKDYQPLKGAMWAFRKRPEDLKEEEWQLLEKVFEYSTQLKTVYDLREELTAIFDIDYSKAGAKCALRAWCRRVRNYEITAFDRFICTLENWFDEITNYFLERLTSAFVEGFNNRVKVMKRRCYGIFNIKHIFQRLTLDLNGYERFA